MKLGIIDHALLVKVQDLLVENANLRNEISELESRKGIVVDVILQLPAGNGGLGQSEIDMITKMAEKIKVKTNTSI